MLGRRGLLAVSVSVSALVVGVGGVQLLPGVVPAARATGLTPYADCAALLAHYRGEVRSTATPYGFGVGGDEMYAVEDSASSVGGAARSASEPSAVGAGATGTNLQEQGVDEPDLAKLRDGRLVVLARNGIQVLSADDQPQLLGSLRLGAGRAVDGPTYGGELLLVGDRALVVTPGYRQLPQPLQQGDPSKGASTRLMRYFPGTPTTHLVLVDLSTDQPRLLEKATYDGQYVSARLVGDTVRLVTTSSPRAIALQPQRGGAAAEGTALAVNQRTAESLSLSDVLPQVVRTAPDGKVLQRGNAVGCDQTTHAKKPRGASTLLVTTMQPTNGLGGTDSTAVTTDGDLVYASEDRLYVATSRWGTVGGVRSPGGIALWDPRSAKVTTEIHSFDTTSEQTTRYVGTGSVPGYVLGRWALSEYEGTLRVATTLQPPWTQENAGRSSSMVVKLVERGGDLVETGRVEGLGKTEQIKAVRYFGNVAAVVTFRQTDPLYLVDLSGTPKVLGELKVPGFSTYLHPIGDGKLLGLGQDATEDGMITGMQLSVFDISDLSNPSLVDRLSIGSGYSPALDDSRAFGYDPDRRLVVFPFSGYDKTGGSVEMPSAIGIHVGSDGRLREVGRTTGDPTNPPSRVLLDGERVFAVGESGVVAALVDPEPAGERGVHLAVGLGLTGAAAQDL